MTTTLTTWVFVSANLINGGQSLEVNYRKDHDPIFIGAGRSYGAIDGQIVWNEPPQETIEDLRCDIFEVRKGRIVLIKTKEGNRITKQVTKVEESWK